MSTKPVFISYASADVTQANQLKSDLENRNIPIWIDQKNLTPGTPDWESAIEKAIPDCQAVIYLASPKSKASKYVRHELKLAEHHNILIIPFWITGRSWLDVAPFGMATAQYIDARQNYTQALSKLLPFLQAGEITPPPTYQPPPPIYQTVPPKQTPSSPSKNQTQRTILISTSLIVTLILVTTGILYARTHATSTTPTWHIITSPNTGSASSYLKSITALAANDIWSVGSDTPQQTLIEHWNGSAWAIVRSPNIGSADNFLSSITALTTNNIWAVGYSTNFSYTSIHTLIEHWNGTTWAIVRSPNTGSADNFLSSITALAADNIWAIGYSGNISLTPSQPLIEHWNGSTWAIIPNPNSTPADSALYSTTALAADNIWAVGGSESQPFIERWNDTTWTITPSPNIGSASNYLNSITALATDNIWAAGYSGSTSGTSSQPLIEHWNGSTWTITPSPNTKSANSYLLSITALATNNIWAIGHSGNTSNTSSQPLIEHWNGSTWTIASSPNTRSASGSLAGITTLADNNIWAVGGTESQPLIEHYSSS